MSEVTREIGSIVSKLRSLLADTKKDFVQIKSLRDVLKNILDDLWQSSDVLHLIITQALRRELFSLIASGRIVSLAAQTEEVLDTQKDTGIKTWIGDGRQYANWLGSGVAALASESNGIEAAADLCGTSFNIGYTDDLVENFIRSTLLEEHPRLERFKAVVSCLQRHQQRQFLFATMSLMTRKGLPMQTTLDRRAMQNSTLSRNVCGCAFFLREIISSEVSSLASVLTSWLLRINAISTELTRAIICALPQDQRETLLEESWKRFGDKLCVQHNSIIQQDTLAQMLLITAGYVHRNKPMHVFMLAHSSTHTSGTSTRLGSSSERARYLGMVVAMAISQLADKPGMKMTFQFEHTMKEEVNWYQSLTLQKDEIGTIEDLKALFPKKTAKLTIAKVIPKRATSRTKPAKPKIMVVEEIDEDEDNEFIPYAKPDSDAEDDDEDAELVNRDVPKIPNYIRDLIKYLEDTKNHDQYILALRSGPALIRRKADFGSEVKDRCEELAAIYTGLHDVYDTIDFHELRLQGMIAVLIAQPRHMGPWYANTFYTGDYSASQRVAILTAMGLGARELAGFNEDKEADTFPTKSLPERLHKLYSDSSEITALAERLDNTTIKQVSSKKRPRQRLVQNDLAKMVAESFFFPLTGRWQSSGISNQGQLTGLILPTYLKTLSIILTSAGPTTITLPQMSIEFWDLLLSVRSRTLGDPASLEALLFSFLSLLSVNDDKRGLAEKHAKELLETHEWVSSVFERMQDGRVVSEEEERCRGLAASVLMATKEVVDKYNRLLLGDMVDFTGGG